VTVELVRLSTASTAPRLLCLPHAGGRGDFYRRWTGDLAGTLEVWTVALPGRHRRAGEPAETDLDAVVKSIAVQSLELLDRPLAIFGHSMGAILGLEVVREMETSGPPLRGLVVSGCSAPLLRAPRTGPDQRTDEDLAGLLKSWGGTPPELLGDSAFLHAALPVLRADLVLYDQYQVRPGQVRTPLMALAGSTDTTAPAVEVGAWSGYAGDWRGLRVLPGGHFFIYDAQRAVIDAIIATAYSIRGPLSAVDGRA
jgi:surfactin synthase thioesterase subunit